MSSLSPAVILYNADGVAMSVSNGVAIPVGTNALIIAGSDGTNSRFVRTANDGTVRVDPTGTTSQPVAVGSWIGSAAPTVGQKVAASSLPVVFASDQPTIPVSIALPPAALVGLAIGMTGPSTVVANVRTPIFATPYTEQLTNGQRSVKSSSASDAAAGVGVRTIKITYLDQTMAGPFTEALTMNGLTAVVTAASNICFIEKIEAATVGSGGANVGTISLYVNTGGTGTVIASIGVGNQVATVGDNRTLLALHYVPTGKTATFATIVGGTTGNQNGIEYLSTSLPTVVGAAEVQTSDVINIALNNPSAVRTLGLPFSVTGPARVTMYLVPAGNNTKFWGSFDYSEVNS